MKVRPKMSYFTITLKQLRPGAQKKPFFPNTRFLLLGGFGMLQELVCKEGLYSEMISGAALRERQFICKE